MSAKANIEAYETVWQAIPDSSQELAIDCLCDHILYEGARGPGKTITQLMKFRRYVGLGYGEYWRGVIFDLEFDNLAGLVAESKKWFPKFDDGAVFLNSPSSYKWVWPTGEELLFRHVKKIQDYEGFHGHEYPFIGWNELTKQPNSNLYEKFMSVNRSTFQPEMHTPSFKADHLTLNAYLCKDGEYRVFNTHDFLPLPKIPLIVFSTTNPDGAGHNWVKRKFITCAPRGSIVRTEVEVFNPQTQSNCIVTKTQTTIFGSYRENIYLPPEYIAELESITDENLRRAWLYGDWDIISGGAFDDLWRARTHVVPRFIVPKGWRLDRSFDWGSTHPFSVGWWAEANGEDALIVQAGEVFTFCPPAGTLIQFAEWYGAKEIGTNKGLKLSAYDIAEGIKKKEADLRLNGWILGNVWAGPADNQIGNVTEIDVEKIKDKMLEKGVDWTASNKKPGSRVIGLQLARDRLQAALKGEGPAVYFMSNCVASISILPTLPRDKDAPDDIDTKSEDHIWDMMRYRLLKGSNNSAGNVPVTMSY